MDIDVVCTQALDLLQRYGCVTYGAPKWLSHCLPIEQPTEFVAAIRSGLEIPL